MYHTCSYSQGTGRIWLDNVNCYSYSTRLSSCSHRGWGVHDCSHYEDIALQCSNTTNTSVNSQYTISIQFMIYVCICNLFIEDTFIHGLIPTTFSFDCFRWCFEACKWFFFRLLSWPSGDLLQWSVGHSV